MCCRRRGRTLVDIKWRASGAPRIRRPLEGPRRPGRPRCTVPTPPGPHAPSCTVATGAARSRLPLGCMTEAGGLVKIAPSPPGPRWELSTVATGAARSGPRRPMCTVPSPPGPHAREHSTVATGAARSLTSGVCQSSRAVGPPLAGWSLELGHGLERLLGALLCTAVPQRWRTWWSGLDRAGGQGTGENILAENLGQAVRFSGLSL